MFYEFIADAMVINYEFAHTIAYDVQAGSLVCLHCQRYVGPHRAMRNGVVYCDCGRQPITSMRIWSDIVRRKHRVLSPNSVFFIDSDKI